MAKEYIERDALCESVNARLNTLRDEYGYYDHYTDGFDECVDRIEEFPSSDVVEVENIKAWLYEIAMNNVGVPIEDFASACEEIISRLGGLVTFDKERREIDAV